MHVHFSVDYRAPYALRFHVEGPYAQRSFWLDDLPVVVRLSQREPDGPLLADVYSDRSIDEHSAALRAAVRHMVAADDDLHDFSVAVARDRKMTRLIEGLPGLKPLRVPDLWTTLLRSLLSQQVSTAAARAIRERLSRAHGHIVHVNDEEITVVPDVEKTARLAEADLVACGLSRRKAEYARGSLVGALNLPLRELRERATELDTDLPVVAFCDTGRRSASATFLLTERGFDARWVEKGVPESRLTSVS